MASIKSLMFLLALTHIILALSCTSEASDSSLNPNYYAKVCPDALPTIKRVVEEAIKQEKRMGASLLRLHFHDCFVHGCDASVLLDATSTMESEKDALPNLNSIRGFNVVDDIKSAVDKACGRPTVSCADILAVAARDSVVALGGPTWEVPLGRRDSTAAYQALADANLPSFALNLSGLISNFKQQGLDERDLVALSGGHAIGYAKCATFKNHIYNESNIDPVFARNRQATCPANGGDNNLAPLDTTAARFDTLYYSNLIKRRGLLHSDQELFKGGSTDTLVKSYSANPTLFSKDFANSMIKMGKIQVLTGKSGQIRTNCRKIN